MADMSTLADAANLATTAALPVALVFGVAQLVAARREGKQRATVEVVRALQTAGFIQAQQRVLDLPPDLSREEFRGRGAHVFEWFQWLANEDERHSSREGPAAYERGARTHRYPNAPSYPSGTVS
jgi:erythromycin esterase-like protein